MIRIIFSGAYRPQRGRHPVEDRAAGLGVQGASICMCMYVYVYNMYIYIYIYVHIMALIAQWLEGMD